MHTSLIYLLLALNLTIDQENRIATELDLPEMKVNSIAQIQDFSLLPPRNEPDYLFDSFRDFEAAIRTTNFNFCVSRKMFGITRLYKSIPEEDWHDQDHQLGVPRDSVSEEMAYQQARRWLEKLGVDVAALEEKHKPRVKELELPLTDSKTISGGYTIRWGSIYRPKLHPQPVAEVCVNASKRILVQVTLNDPHYYLNRLPQIPHAIAINLLPDEPVRKFFHLGPHDRIQCIFKQNEYGYTNVFKLLETPPEYEAKARQLMLVEARQILGILECDQVAEFSETNLTDIYVNPPAFGSGGRLEFTNGEMQFNSKGQLHFFHFLPQGQTNYSEWMSTRQSLMTTNEAYQLAMQKLAALSVDVSKLNLEYKCFFGQARHFRYAEDGAKVWFYTPEYCLQWRNRSQLEEPAAIKIAVYGDIKKVGYIELNDESCWKRPPIVVSDSTNALNASELANASTQTNTTQSEVALKKSRFTRLHAD